MYRSITLGMAMLAGVVVGAVAVGGMAARGAGGPIPGAYAIIDISEITDPDVFTKQLLPRAEAPVTAYDGKFLTRTQDIVALDGTPPKRFVIISFDSLETAKAWAGSAAQKEVDALRVKSARGRTFIAKVDGAN
jgi:uncharacterized protein (DUF1330 family)